MSAATTSGAVTSTRSPFALLRDAEQAEEVLILTYAANLEFFERFALGEARGLQAATTLISDAGMVSVDPQTVRGAGLRYLDARAICPGRAAFHPKLLVIAGRDRSTIAVGSGNLTLPGWHGNEELWTYFHASAARGPRTVAQVAAFLRNLADGPIQLSPEAPAAIAKTCEVLDLMGADEPGPELASTLDGPIIHRLPEGPVDELNLYAPFFDADFGALTALHTRFGPDRLRVFLHPETSVDGPRLERWMSERGGELFWCSGERYRHGKLIEWRRGDELAALTGSPNLSGRALLNGVGGDDPAAPPANCELALIDALGESLAPPQAPPPPSGVATLHFRRDPDDPTRPGIVLLGATLVEGVELVLRLAESLTAPARIQVHDPERDWITAEGVPALEPGKTEYCVPALLFPAGRPLRLYGPARASKPIFVTDPVRARKRPYRRVGPEAGTQIELFMDGRLDVLFQIAELMRPELMRMKALVPGAAPQPRPEDERAARPDPPLRPRDGQTLEDYIAACAAVANEQLIEWALVLPTLPSLGIADQMAERTGFLTSETDDEAADAGQQEDEQDEKAPPPEFETALRHATEHRRRQLRRFCEVALDRAAAWPNSMRALLARFVLTGAALELWPDDDDRDRLLVELVAMLAAPGDEPIEAEERAVTTYIGVALAVLRSRVTRLSRKDEPTLRYKDAAAAAARRGLDEVDEEVLERLAASLEEGFGATVGYERVANAMVELKRPTGGLEAAIAALSADYGTRASADGAVLVIEDPLPALPERDLLRAASLVRDVEPVVVRGTLAGDRRAACVWRAPDLLLARETPHGTTGRLYRLTRGTPATIVAGWSFGSNVRDNLPDPVADWFAKSEPPDEAVELLRIAGF